MQPKYINQPQYASIETQQQQYCLAELMYSFKRGSSRNVGTPQHRWCGVCALSPRSGFQRKAKHFLFEPFCAMSFYT